VMALCTLLSSMGTGVGRVRDDTLVMVLIGLMALGTAAFMANYFSFTQEVSPRHTGLIVGILGGLGNLCAAGFLPVVGRVKDTTGSFAPIFLIVGLLPFVGLGALLLGWRSSLRAAKPD
jgi:ACS family hexuronate transporter-like MFS transporter